MIKVDRLYFRGEARKVKIDGEDHVSVWTDGIGISSDDKPHCKMRLIPGKTYEVTIREYKETSTFTEEMEYARKEQEKLNDKS